MRSVTERISRKRVVRGMCLCMGAGVAVVWLATGGCVTYDNRFFQDESSGNRYVPYVRAEVRGSISRRGIPFAFESYAKESVYSLHLVYITHTVVDNPSYVETLHIEYDDGQKVDLGRLIQPRLIPMRDKHFYYDKSDVHHEVPSLRAEFGLDDCIDRFLPFTLKVGGQLYSGNDRCESFDYSLYFIPRRTTLTATRWHWLALQSM